MTNLLKETMSVLKDHNKELKDIVAVQGKKFGLSVEKFIELADEDYYSGYGSPQVAEDLIVIGQGWWLERHEYDGSEWWEYKELFEVLPIKEDICALIIDQSPNPNISCGWEDLETLNKVEADDTLLGYNPYQE